jgi:hypothetical protein
MGASTAMITKDKDDVMLLELLKLGSHVVLKQIHNWYVKEK